MFNEATFEGDAIFQEATFEGDADFVLITFRSIVNFIGATFNRGAIFHEATFNRGAIFHEATFEGDTIFQKATFEGDAIFMEATFKGNADFVLITFRSNVNFIGATFNRDAIFHEATFEGDAIFAGAIFEGRAHFEKATFEGDGNFKKATFKGPVSFEKAGFQSDVEYINLNFKKIVNFTFAVFSGKVYFKNIIFQKLADFSNSVFKNPTYFANIRAKSGINFGLSNFTSALNLDLICEKGIISFKGAFLENSFLAFNLDKETFIDFDYARLRNTEIRRIEIQGHILQEKERKYKKAKEIYFILKKNFVTIGRYSDRGWALIKEKLMERMEYSFYEYIKKKKEDLKINIPSKNIFLIIEFFKYLFSGIFLKWFNLYFMDVLLGYGEQPHKVIIFSMLVILIFASIYSTIGISNPGDLEINSKIQNELSQGKVKIEGITKLSESEAQKDLKFETKGQKDLKIEITEFDLFVKKKNISRRNFRDCLYYSLVVFTTLGLGDFHPLPEGRIITGIEGLLGAILMGLFVAMLSRKFFGSQF